MAIKEIIVKAGEPIPDSLESVFVQWLGQKAIVTAKEKGAKIKLSITSPWPKLPVVKKEKVVVNEVFVSQLKELASDETQLETEISKLSGPEILKVATILHFPMSKSSKVRSLKEQLLKSLRSEIIWRSIAGQSIRLEHTEARVAEEPDVWSDAKP